MWPGSWQRRQAHELNIGRLVDNPVVSRVPQNYLTPADAAANSPAPGIDPAMRAFPLIQIGKGAT
jgi:hypothetical protein